MGTSCITSLSIFTIMYKWILMGLASLTKESSSSFPFLWHPRNKMRKKRICNRSCDRSKLNPLETQRLKLLTFLDLTCLTLRSCSCLTSSPQNALLNEMELSELTLPTPTKASFGTTTKIESQSFWTWLVLLTKRISPHGLNARSLQCMMVTGEMCVPIFWETICINLLSEMMHFPQIQKMLWETDLLKLKRCSWIWLTRSTKVNETGLLTILTKAVLVLSRVWLSTIWSILRMSEIREQSWVLKEATRFTLFLETIAPMTNLKRCEFSKTEGKSTRPRPWPKYRRLAG